MSSELYRIMCENDLREAIKKYGMEVFYNAVASTIPDHLLNKNEQFFADNLRVAAHNCANLKWKKS